MKFRFLPVLLLLMATTTVSAQNYNITFRSKLTFSDQTVANVSGWASPDGKEYALVGASKGLIIVDVTAPDHPVQIVQIPGPDNRWKEIKTYSHYAYVVSQGDQGGQGVQIVDLNDLPFADLPNKFYKGDGAITDQLNNIHALHIDLTKGYLYAYGSNLFKKGAVVFSLSDPWNPTYVGKFDQLGYIHDGYVDNDTLYASHISSGEFSIVDMTDKSAPLLLNTQPTPNANTHNTWLSEDRKTIFTTDETDNSFVAAYDVSDPTDIKFLDKIQTNPGSGGIVHNTHIRGNFAITAWYKEGVTIVDATNPGNLVETGNYDTYPQGSGGGSFDGCWGVYPYLPSGNLVAGNITPGELWVLTPTYRRACYLEGTITGVANGQPIFGATVQIVGYKTSIKTTGAGGLYHTGIAEPGMVQVLVTKPGYQPVFASADLITGEVVHLDVALPVASIHTIGGQVVRSTNSSPISNAHVSITSTDTTYRIIADGNGQFVIPNVIAGVYEIMAGAWGYQYKVQNQVINTNQQVVLELDEGYQDDFVFDFGWQASGTSLEGKWERTDHPLGVSFLGNMVAPSEDVMNDIGASCFVTGNSTSSFDGDDVESGTSILISPAMDLSDYLSPRVSAKVWCISANDFSVAPDSIKIYVSNGIQESLAWQRKGSSLYWHSMGFDVTDFVPLSNTIQIRIVCFDKPDGSVIDCYEGAFDQFKVIDQPLSSADPDQTAALTAKPNPFSNTTIIACENFEDQSIIKVFDLLGQPVQSYKPGNIPGGQVVIGEGLSNGVYFVRLEQKGQISRSLKVIKMD